VRSNWGREAAVTEAGPLQRLSPPALVAGLAAAGLLVLGFVVQPVAAARSYLVGYLWVLGIALGSMVIVFIQFLTGGAWGVIIRRPAEAAMRTLPALAVLFLPLALSAGILYPWAQHHEGEPLHNAWYLNLPSFWVRAAVYFLIWIGLSLIVNRWSARQDAGSITDDDRRFRLLAGPGLGLYGLAITFASFDWIMSMDPHWFSAIFGVLVASGQMVSGLSFCIVVVLLLADRPPFRAVLVPGHLRDLGSLLLAFSMLWTYMSISQFILIWSGNVQEEVPFYVARSVRGWPYVALALFLLQYAVPFLILLTRDGKRNPQRLLLVAGLCLVMRVVDLLWLAAPSRALDSAGSTVTWTDPVGVVAVGGLWLWLFVRELGRRPLLPVNADPSVAEDHHG